MNFATGNFALVKFASALEQEVTCKIGNFLVTTFVVADFATALHQLLQLQILQPYFVANLLQIFLNYFNLQPTFRCKLVAKNRSFLKNYLQLLC